MANNTLAKTIDWALPYIQYSPLTAGTNSEPAISIASMIQTMIMSAPFTWSWNRKENSSITLQQSLQDYTLNITDFGYLEKASITDSDGKIWELKDDYNAAALVKSTTEARPAAIAVISQVLGTSVTFRFSAVPNAAYTLNLIYQKNTALFTATPESWIIPDAMMHIYNTLFLGEAFAIVEDPRSQLYRQRGIAGLLSVSEGLDEEDKAIFMQQYLNMGVAVGTAGLKSQQGYQGRTI